MKFQVSKSIQKGIIVLLGVAVVISGIFWGYPLYQKSLKEKELIQKIQENKNAANEYVVVLEREQQLKKDPKNADFYLSLGNHWDAIAGALNSSLAREHAVQAYERGIAVVGSAGDLLYLNAGNDYISLGRFAEAEKMFKEVIQKNPGNSSGYLKLIELYRMQMKKGPEDIMPIFQEGLDRLVENAYLVQSLAEYYVQLGQPEKALQYYELLAKKYPGQFDPIVAKIMQQISSSSTQK